MNMHPGPGMILAYNGSGNIEWRDDYRYASFDPSFQPEPDSIRNAMKCDYCSSLHHSLRCPSCGAPASRKITKVEPKKPWRGGIRR